jgi:hypothetical protein
MTLWPCRALVLSAFTLGSLLPPSTHAFPSGILPAREVILATGDWRAPSSNSPFLEATKKAKPKSKYGDYEKEEDETEEEKPLEKMGAELLGDLRFTIESVREQMLGLELGAGLQFPQWRFSFGTRIVPMLGFTGRAAYRIPFRKTFSFEATGEVPVMFTYAGTLLGLGAAAGAQWAVNEFISVYAEVGARFFFNTPVIWPQCRIVGQTGVLIRLPFN